ncbi:MraW methylase family-domain-containing protein [Pelagophyceae sp. CCMP2097]|nr:MraW methylase family-domain-containing protein [Pelagophyceae sp. CCMP2097]
MARVAAWCALLGVAAGLQAAPRQTRGGALGAGAPADGDARPVRRARYSGLYPSSFKEKYKELRGDAEIAQHVISKGNTPAGSHVPIMVDECLEHLGLAGASGEGNELAVDCTLGYGGHSTAMLAALKRRAKPGTTPRLVSFDRDAVEVHKAAARLAEAAGAEADNVKVVHSNFRHALTCLGDDAGSVTCLLADLGLSSMQIDDDSRGFSYKRDAPLDMRMNNADGETAHQLLLSLKPKDLQRILADHSDEPHAQKLSRSLLVGFDGPVPSRTVELADRVRKCVSADFKDLSESDRKFQLDRTVARVNQALRIEVNGEFDALEGLLQDLPSILAPGGRAVFLTFHSGEDRRVKKAFKAGCKAGIYSDWGADVVRPSAEEQRLNPRSSCAKLRWAVRAAQPAPP